MQTYLEAGQEMAGDVREWLPKGGEEWKWKQVREWRRSWGPDTSG